jgi:sulfate transport system permease protein
MPGFSLCLGYSVSYLSLLVLIPLAAIFLKASSLSFHEFMAVVWTDRARAAYALTFGAALAASLINAVLGLNVAWVLARYDFPGKRIIDAFVDLPFALPTPVWFFRACMCPTAGLASSLLPWELTPPIRG